jgi:sulfite exporter TauE/SafE
LNLSAVLLTGLFAGGVSCAAVQGGLLAGLVARQRETRETPAQVPATKESGAERVAANAPQRSTRGRIADDLTPVGSFLAGKLVSHTLLGALLGAVGGAVQLSVPMRAITQTLAGALVVVFGLAQLGVPGFRDLVIEPPASWSRFVRGRARSSSAFAPGLLGLATVLIPCGVTLSVEALALTSGSAWAGAATMAVFVVGTSPLFAALGFAARKAATAWRGRLAVVTGVIVLAMGLYTLNGGLELAGSPLAASRIAAALGAGPEPVNNTATTASEGDSEDEFVTVAGGKQTVTIRAKTGRYIPDNLQVRSGLPTTLVVRSEDADGCVRSFVIPERNKEVVLPVNGDTKIDLGTLKPGRLDYSCGMGMYTGALTIR